MISFYFLTDLSLDAAIFHNRASWMQYFVFLPIIHFFWATLQKPTA